MLVGTQPPPDVGFAVIVCWVSGQLQVLLQKVVVPPAKRALWHFPGGMMQPGVDQLTSLATLVNGKCGAGIPPGIPPLVPVHQFSIPSRSSLGKTRLFCILLLQQGVDQGKWDLWQPCPTPAHQHEFVDGLNTPMDVELKLGSQKFPTKHGHVWASWGAVFEESNAWVAPATSVLHSDVIMWFTRNGDKMFEIISKFIGVSQQSVAPRAKFSGPKSQSQSHQNNKPCHFFAKGQCKKGQNCPFVHQVCNNIRMGVPCKYADNCRFSHDLSLVNTTNTTTSSYNPASTTSTPTPTTGMGTPQTSGVDAQQIAYQFLQFFHQKIAQDASTLSGVYVANAQLLLPAGLATGSAAITQALIQHRAQLRELSSPQNCKVDVQSSGSPAQPDQLNILIHLAGSVGEGPAARRFAHCFLLCQQGVNNWMVLNHFLRFL
eukprot:c3939_g1_i1.p1 GENE.c3939_g1_i1~~c3939_g1_i1.p1  ORF type:complete len:445 (-),score=79.27 c3939_g1_i1:63-1355(-)